MGSTTSKLDTPESSPTPVDKTGKFDITVSEELKENMNGTSQSKSTSSNTTSSLTWSNLDELQYYKLT